jgi:hypothetical protein
MVDQVPFRRGQSLSRFAAKPSFAGRGLVERMRTTAFALLGVTTAMALGLVALASQQSWHYLPVGPLPSYQAQHGKLHSAIAVGSAAAELGTSSDTPIDRALFRGAAAMAGSNESRLAGSHRVSQSGAPDPAPAQPDGASPPPRAPGATPPDRASDPTPVSPPVAPPPLPAPATPSPTATVPLPAPAPSAVAASNPGKGHAYGRQKATAPPKPKPSHPAPGPTATVPTAEPAPPTAEPAPSAPAPGLSDGPGKGHGHAYGHDK